MTFANQQVLVFDVGGSHIAAGVFDPCRKTLGHHNNALVANAGSPAEILGVFETLAKDLCANRASLIGVSVAVPNPFDCELGISYMQHKYTQLHAVNIRSGLSRVLGCDAKRIHFLNDAAAFLMGEISQGAANQVSRAVGITLGTGVGSAFALDGEIVVSGEGVPPDGEIWNFPYRDGTVEDAVSTRAIQKLYLELTGASADVSEIARLITEQPSARETFRRFGKELGNALRATCAAFAPARIVLGGGIARAGALFLAAAEAELDGLAFSLRLSELDDRAPLVGAGVSWINAHMPKQVLQRGGLRSNVEA